MRASGLDEIPNGGDLKYAECATGLSKKLFVFRIVISTADAIAMVTEMTRQAIAYKMWLGGSMEYCGIMTVNVRNSLNSVR